jgi:hypothetical protein
MTYATKFYKELEFSLATSTEKKRKIWAGTIIEKDIDIKDLSKLLKGEQKIAIRFLWLLSDIGILNPNKLLAELPFLFDLCEHLNPIYKISFASFWMYVGVPSENEGKAIDLLFHFLLSNDTNVTTKSRSLLVLFKLTKKYPELKSELKLCLKDQIGKHTNNFEKRATKILIELER